MVVNVPMDLESMDWIQATKHIPSSDTEYHGTADLKEYVPPSERKGTEFEEKVIRHVRTPAGVAKYGQPIGSVIVRDVMRRMPGLTLDPDMKLKWRHLPTKGGVATKYAKLPEQYGRDTYGVQFGVPERNRNVEVAIMLEAAGGVDVKTAVQKLQNEYIETLPALVHRDHPPIDEYFDKSLLVENESQEALDSALEVEKRTKVLVQSGVDTPAVQAGWVDFSNRRTAPEAKRLVPSAQTRGIVNSVADTYVKKFGPIHKVVGRVMLSNEAVQGFDGTPADWLAYEHDNEWFSPFTGTKTAAIHLNTNYVFSTDDDNMLQKDQNAIDRAQLNPDTTFNSIDYQEVARRLGIPIEEAFRLGIVHHEFGHAFGDIIMGVNPQWLDDHIDPAYAPLIMKMQEDLSLMANHLAVDDPRQGYILDPIATARYVSNYGAANIFEHLAEVWAAYMFNSDVTEYVRDLGGMMDAMVTAVFTILEHGDVAEAGK